MTDLKSHWEKVYTKNKYESLGWFEENPQPSIDLLEKCNLSADDLILNAGAGASTFIDELVNKGYENIVATDLSLAALESLQQRLGEQASKVQFIEDDLTKPQKLQQVKNVKLWHDRAVLHFFIDEKDQNTYFDLLKKVIAPNGFVIIAAFAIGGATKCSGLPIKNYNIQMLSNKLGDDFELIESFDFLYHTPSGNPRDYIYTLYQKK